MIDQWYYSHENEKTGPCSAAELRELAAAGRILPTDTIWKEGMERGVSAAKVKNLFPPGDSDQRSEAGVAARGERTAPTEVPDLVGAGMAAALRQAPGVPSTGSAEPAAGEMAEETTPAATGQQPEQLAPAGQGSTSPGEEVPAEDKPSKPAAPAYQTRKGRAIAGQGVVIVSQDGLRVQFRKKCTSCGYEDTSRSSLPIRHGLMRSPFYCPKCRKVRQVEIQGITK